MLSSPKPSACLTKSEFERDYRRISCLLEPSWPFLLSLWPYFRKNQLSFSAQLLCAVIVHRNRASYFRDKALHFSYFQWVEFGSPFFGPKNLTQIVIWRQLADSNSLENLIWLISSQNPIISLSFARFQVKLSNPQFFWFELILSSGCASFHSSNHWSLCSSFQQSAELPGATTLTQWATFQNSLTHRCTSWFPCSAYRTSSQTPSLWPH